MDYGRKTRSGSWLSWSQCCFQFWHNKWLSLNVPFKAWYMSHLIPDHQVTTIMWSVRNFSIRVMMGTVTQIVAWPKIKSSTNITHTAHPCPLPLIGQFLMTQASHWPPWPHCCPQMATSWSMSGGCCNDQAPSLFSVQGPHNTSLVTPHSANRFSLYIAVPDK